jgi:hypothetical protein
MGLRSIVSPNAISGAVATCAVLVCHTSLAASLSLLSTWSGRGFNVSHSGAQLAAFVAPSVCVYSITDRHRQRTCIALPIDQANVEPRVRWAPDDSALAVSGEDAQHARGIWIIRLTDARVMPIRVHTGPRSGTDELQGFLDARHVLLSPRYGGWVILDVDTGATSSCGWSETDGRTEWDARSGYIAGTNRFGDAQVSRVVARPGGPALACSRAPPAVHTQAAYVWNQFEAVLAPNRLLFSRQRYDAALYWAIGAELVALDAASLETVATYPKGAPAAVSPRGDLIAALRPNLPDGLRFVIYSVSDTAPVVDVASAIPFTPAPDDSVWAGLRPKWSLDGRFVLIVESDVVRRNAELVSVANGTIEPVLDDIPPVLAIEWLTANRLIVSNVGDEIRTYALRSN